MRFFPKNVNIGIGEYGQIWTGDLKNQVLRKSISYICIRHVSKRVKGTMRTFTRHFQVKICHIDRFESKPFFLPNPKISVVLKIDIPLRSVNMGRNGNPSRSGTRVGVPEKTTRKFFKNIDFKIFP